jgi:hypothetical protein
MYIRNSYNKYVKSLNNDFKMGLDLDIYVKSSRGTNIETLK